jgi:hypothetical protein
MYQAVITKLENVRRFEGADRLQLANALGYQVVVGLDAKEGDVMILFPDDGQLSEKYCEANDLIGYTDDEGNKKGGYFDHKRRVKAQTFRKAKSEAYVAGLDTVLFTGVSSGNLVVGTRFTELNGVPICNKYYTPATLRASKGGTPKTQSGYNKEALKKLFPEHTDTEQLRFARDEELVGLVTLTHKLHGTSARTGNIKFPVLQPLTMFQRAWNKYISVCSKWTSWFPWADAESESNAYFHESYNFEQQIVYGTRRVVKGKVKDVNQDYRSNCARILAPSINKGEIWYYEIVGYEDTGALIMGTVGTNEMPKDFRKRFGDTISYTYGCLPGTCEIYVYRITYQNEDGVVYELPWANVKDRCKKAGIKHVPEISCYIPGHAATVKENVEYLCENVDIAEPLDVSHIREGVCVRIDNLETGKMKIFKNKTFAFKVIEGIAKSNETTIDEEELEGLEG